MIAHITLAGGDRIPVTIKDEAHFETLVNAHGKDNVVVDWGTVDHGHGHEAPPKPKNGKKK